MRRLSPIIILLALCGCGGAVNHPAPPTAPPPPPLATVQPAQVVIPPTPTVAPTASPTPTPIPLSSAIVGEWAPASTSNIRGPYLAISRIAFYSDGTTVVDDVFAHAQAGRYSVDGKALKLLSANGTVGEYTATFDGDTLVISDGIVAARFLRRR